tara:strand:- start:3501 stop:3869 length:369 start_codon:yes stop_codon:yes gene_type:complete
LGLAAFFINVGVDQFVNPTCYVNIMPACLPLDLEAVHIGGFLEVLGGVCLNLPAFRSAAGWDLVALLIVVFPANTHMALNPDLFPEIALNLLHVRLIFQFIFIYWAYSATRPSMSVVLDANT